jgi:hypothetical protein
MTKDQEEESGCFVVYAPWMDDVKYVLMLLL